MQKLEPSLSNVMVRVSLIFLDAIGIRRRTHAGKTGACLPPASSIDATGARTAMRSSVMVSFRRVFNAGF